MLAGEGGTQRLLSEVSPVLRWSPVGVYHNTKQLSHVGVCTHCTQIFLFIVIAVLHFIMMMVLSAVICCLVALSIIAPYNHHHHTIQLWHKCNFIVPEVVGKVCRVGICYHSRCTWALLWLWWMSFWLWWTSLWWWWISLWWLWMSLWWRCKW